MTRCKFCLEEHQGLCKIEDFINAHSYDDEKDSLSKQPVRDYIRYLYKQIKKYEQKTRSSNPLA